LALDNTSLETIILFNQPLYSPYLALKAFWLFPKIKCALRGLRLAAIETIEKNMPEAEKLVAIKKWELEKAFQKCCRQWLHDWN
jgi:hypothetical protein